MDNCSEKPLEVVLQDPAKSSSSTNTLTRLQKYTRHQLLQLRTQPASQIVPDCKYQLGNLALARINLLPKFARMSTQHPHEPIARRPSCSNPSSQSDASQKRSETSYNNKQQQQSSGGGNKHNSNRKNHQRNQNGGNKNKSMSDSKDAKSDMVHISLSIKEEVKLNESENAWKPRVMQSTDKTANPENNTDVLYKSVRSILNKLTFANFDVLLEQLKKLDIDTMDKLNGVILLVFDKAIDEPQFSRAYAQLCENLVEHCFPVDTGSRKLFKTTLITKCQFEFERNVTGGASGTEGNMETLRPMREELEQTTDPERKQELQAAIADLEQMLRRRTVCTVGFIGELYRIGMLTTKIINRCVCSLLDSRSEEKLECLCKLLATVGQQVESKAGEKKNYIDLTEYFKQIRRIINQKGNRPMISNRVKFMLQDIIDLRNNNWTPRRQ